MSSPQRPGGGPNTSQPPYQQQAGYGQGPYLPGGHPQAHAQQMPYPQYPQGYVGPQQPLQGYYPQQQMAPGPQGYGMGQWAQGPHPTAPPHMPPPARPPHGYAYPPPQPQHYQPSHYPTHPPPAPLAISPEERAVYDRLFDQEAGAGPAGWMGGKEAVEFLSRSNLPKPLLRQIWSLSDPHGRGALDRVGFYHAMRLLCLAQCNLAHLLSDPSLPGIIQRGELFTMQLPGPLQPPRLLASAAQPTTAAQAQASSSPALEAEEEEEFGDFATSTSAVEQQPVNEGLNEKGGEEEEEEGFGEFAEPPGPMAAPPVSPRPMMHTTHSPPAFASPVQRGTPPPFLAQASPVRSPAAVPPSLPSPPPMPIMPESSLMDLSSPAPLPGMGMGSSPLRPPLQPQPSAFEMESRMSAFDSIIEDHDFDDFQAAPTTPDHPLNGNGSGFVGAFGEGPPPDHALKNGSGFVGAFGEAPTSAPDFSSPPPSPASPLKKPPQHTHNPFSPTSHAPSQPQAPVSPSPSATKAADVEEWDDFQSVTPDMQSVIPDTFALPLPSPGLPPPSRPTLPPSPVKASSSSTLPSSNTASGPFASPYSLTPSPSLVDPFGELSTDVDLSGHTGPPSSAFSGDCYMAAKPTATLLPPPQPLLQGARSPTNEWGDFAEAPPLPLLKGAESFRLHKEDISLGLGVSALLSPPNSPRPLSVSATGGSLGERTWAAFEDDEGKGPQGPTDGPMGGVDYASCSLPVLVEGLISRGRLEMAGRAARLLTLRGELAQAVGEKERAKAEERFEDAVGLVKRIRDAQAGVARLEREQAGWRQAMAPGGPTGGPSLEELQRRVEAVDGGRADAFASAFLSSQDSLLVHARRDLSGALSRLRRAHRCVALLEGMGRGPLAAYPDHWLRLVDAAEARLTTAVALLKRVEAMPPHQRKAVTSHPTVLRWARCAWEVIRVARLLFAAAADALLGLVLGEMGRVDALSSTLLSLLSSLSLLPSDLPPLPTIEEVRAAVVASSEDEGTHDAAVTLDPRLVCNLTLLPLCVGKGLGLPVTHFSGAPYFAPCVNLWLNAVSLETPQPDHDDSPF